MNKRLSALLLALIVALSLVCTACSGKVPAETTPTVTEDPNMGEWA